jgi:repressor LexA
MPLSPKRQKILRFISGYITLNHEPPTMKEIGEEFQMTSSASVSNNLTVIEREGFIKRTPNVSRGIQLVEQEKEFNVS